MLMLNYMQSAGAIIVECSVNANLKYIRLCISVSRNIQGPYIQFVMKQCITFCFDSSNNETKEP